jgi:putative transposase
MRGFKSAVTTQAKISGTHDFGWQARFHDHIIRDADSFERIQNYIANNPANWEQDKFYS